MKPLRAKNREALKLFIYRLGEQVPVYVRKEQGSDRLNKPDIVFERVNDSLALKYNNRSKEMELDVGEYNKYEPKFMVPHDSTIEDDCHIIYGGKEYEMVAPQDKGPYVSFQSKSVHVLTESNPNVTVLDQNGNEVQTPING